MKTRTTWNLALLYKNDKDPQIERDMEAIESACASFEKRYRNSSFTKSPETLSQALKAYEVLRIKTNSQKPWWYFALKTDLNSADSKSGASATKYSQRISEALNNIKFFTLEISKIPKKERVKFLKHPSLKKYSYFLTRIFNTAEFQLSEGEEQLEDLLSQTSYTMWTDSTQKIMGEYTIQHRKRSVGVAEAIGLLANLPKDERRKLSDKTNQVLKSLGGIAESELNAIYNYKKIMDKRRGYKKPYSSTILRNENDEKSVEDFVSLVSKYFKLSHRFYKLHAKLLKEKRLTMADRGVKIGNIKATFSFEESISIIRKTLGSIDTEYSALFDSFIKNRQIDIYPKKGKKGGAYCWGMSGLPTFVLLNHVDDIRSIETLAHEMGHAIHTELSQRQPILYHGYSTATAEVASTFFEQLVSDEIEKTLNDKDKIILLHNKILGDVSSIFRQVACFNFENELHELIREKGQLPKGDISNLMTKHLKSYVGPAIDVTHDDGYFFVYWSHIRRFFYVYTYAYGQIISRALYENWKKNPAYAEKIKLFLKSGRSMSPEQIFKSIGVDISKTSFFEAGLKGVEKDILRLEKLANK